MPVRDEWDTLERCGKVAIIKRSPADLCPAFCAMDDRMVRNDEIREMMTLMINRTFRESETPANARLHKAQTRFYFRDLSQPVIDEYSYLHKSNYWTSNSG